MNYNLAEQIKQLKQTIAEMEVQRHAPGDDVVDAALAPLQAKLDELASLLKAQQANRPSDPTRQRNMVTMPYSTYVLDNFTAHGEDVKMLPDSNSSPYVSRDES